jgi:uncharacterized protein (DUF433 family)
LTPLPPACLDATARCVERATPFESSSRAGQAWDDGVVANELLDLIDADPEVVHGQARFRGTRIPVSVVLDCLAVGMTAEEIHTQYPSLPPDAVRAAIAYGALLAREELHPLEPMPR